MALIKSVRGFTPQIGKDCFLADNAAIIGDVTMGDECSIWFGTVLRGDVNTITIGNRVNIQDGSVLHTLYQKSVIEIGNDVRVGHNVTIHGAKICDCALIGMGSVLLDGVEVSQLLVGFRFQSSNFLFPGINGIIKCQGAVRLIPDVKVEAVCSARF